MKELPSIEEMIEISKKEIGKNQRETDELGGITVGWFELFLRVNYESEKRCMDLKFKIEELERKIEKLEYNTAHVVRIG